MLIMSNNQLFNSSICTKRGGYEKMTEEFENFLINANKNFYKVIITSANTMLYGTKEVKKMPNNLQEMVNIVQNNKKLIKYLKYFDYDANFRKFNKIYI